MNLKEKAHAVLLPAFAGVELSDNVKRFLGNGGCSILMGETREEYVGRRMSAQRMAEENAETISRTTRAAESLAGDIIIAVDQEISGICRPHKLVPQFPDKKSLHRMGSSEFETLCNRIGTAAKAMGVNCFLGPILDLVSGQNPWLENRTWSTDPHMVSEYSCAFIRGIQSSGIAATAKHFPGYSEVKLDPTLDRNACNAEPHEIVQRGLIPFQEAVNAGTEIVMLGPAIVKAIDPLHPASTSAKTINILREKIGHKGIIMTDDLDAPAILLGRPITEVAVEALKAGADFLLLADSGNQTEEVSAAIEDAVTLGKLPEARLTDAADKIKSLAARYSAS